MTNLTTFAKRLWKDEDGATAIEYGLLAALVAIAIIAGAIVIGQQLNTTFVGVGQTLSNANTANPLPGTGTTPP